MNNKSSMKIKLIFSIFIGIFMISFISGFSWNISTLFDNPINNTDTDNNATSHDIIKNLPQKPAVLKQWDGNKFKLLDNINNDIHIKDTKYQYIWENDKEIKYVDGNYIFNKEIINNKYHKKIIKSNICKSENDCSFILEDNILKLNFIIPKSKTFLDANIDTEYKEIIEITNALHLDENKNFISDIYDEVYQLDDIWSETILSEHYVRATFEVPLDSSRDITIYPRVVSGTPRIEIYEVNSTELIAEFSTINSNEYNKVYLTGLNGTQDVFDLKIINGSVEFDHIIDPITNGTSATGMTLSLINGMTWNHEFACGDNMMLIVGIAVDSEPTATVSGITYNGTAMSLVGRNTSVDGEEQAEMWYLKDPDCGASLPIVVAWNGATTEESAGGSVVFYGVDSINLSSKQSAVCDGCSASSITVPAGPNDRVVDVIAVDVDPLLTWGDNQTMLVNYDAGVDAIGMSVGNHTSGSVTMTWTWALDEMAHIGVTLIAKSIVSFNQSTLNLGESVSNITSVLKIDSFKTNTNTAITCSGNCTEITTNWTTRTMSNGQSDEVLITCSNATEGIFNAVFNVTSDADSSSNLLTVDCEIFSYGWLNVSIEKPEDNSDWYEGNTNLTINATVTCGGGSNARCGTVNASARYNLTSNPNTLINTSTDEPFYIFGSKNISTLRDKTTNYWKLDETTGTIVVDSSEHTNGTNTNSVTIGIDGKINTAYRFNNNYVAYTRTGLNGNTTVSLWFNMSGPLTRRTFLLGNGYNALAIQTGAETLAWYPDTSGGDSLGSDTLSPLNDSEWHHVFITTEGTYSEMWVDNVLVGNGTTASLSETSSTGRIGMYAGISSEYFVGDVDEVMLLNQIATSSERESVWDNGHGFSYPFIKTIPNIQTSESVLNKDESYQFNWTLNVTSSSIESYLIDVNFTSSYGDALVPNNDTEDRTVNLNPSVEDTIKPTYSLNQTNNTQISQATLFSILYDDDTALNTSGQYIFSTNNTGVWVNDSAINFTATPNWANVTKTLNSTEGISIGYRWYADDNAGNINNTEIFSLITTSADTCTCAGLNNNWEINLADECIITDDCNLSTGNITFINDGSVTFNMVLTANKISFKDNIGVTESYKFGQIFRGWFG